jgi:polysaccharide biosynthesis/export protein
MKCTPIKRLKKACATAMYLALVFILIAFSSCKTSKQFAYFKNLQDKDTSITGFTANNYESKIKSGDKLAISLSSLNRDEDALFNGIAAASGGSATGGAGFNVSQDGTITLHRLGIINVDGLTRRALALKIQNGLMPYTKEPIVNVSYLNHRVTVFGEVGTPQVINLPEEQITIIDALVQCGDIKENGRKDNVTIIREENNQKVVKKLNFEDASIFTSPYFYVKPNDIILVHKDNKKLMDEEKRQRLQSNIGIIASSVGLGVIVITQILK